MSNLVSSAAWTALQNHYETAMKNVHMKELFAKEPDRFANLSMKFDDILLDYSKNRVTDETMTLLYNLAEQQDVKGKTAAMYRGEKINTTEGRAVLHIALRAHSDDTCAIQVDGADVMPAIKETLARIKVFTENVRGGSWKGHTGKIRPRKNGGGL